MCFQGTIALGIASVTPTVTGFAAEVFPGAQTRPRGTTIRWPHLMMVRVCLISLDAALHAIQIGQHVLILTGCALRIA
jgi:hypothetical protein